MTPPLLQDFPILKRLTFLSIFVDFWRERVARGGCFAGVYFFGKNVSDLGSFLSFVCLCFFNIFCIFVEGLWRRGVMLEV